MQLVQKVFLSIDVDLQQRQGVFRQLPEREQLDAGIREQLIVELYSK